MQDDLRTQLLMTMSRFKRFGGRMSMDTSPGAMMALAKIQQMQPEGEGTTVSKLREDMHISMPGISQALNSLEKRGLIARSIAPHDRRKVLVRITPDGARHINCVRRHMDAMLGEVIERMGREDTEALCRLLDKVCDIMEDLHAPHAPNEHAPNEHAADEHAPNEHATDQHASDNHARNEHAPDEEEHP